MKRMAGCLTVLLLLGVGVLGGVLAWYGRADVPSTATAGFSAATVSLPLYDLYDLGVADMNDDDRLDVFTLNHSAQQAMLINDGAGMFSDAIDSLGLGQDYEYPFTEDSNRKPEFAKPGLYVYRLKRVLYLESHKLDNTISGTIDVPWPVTVLTAEAAEHRLDMRMVSLPVGTPITDTRPVQSTLEFSIKPGGTLSLNGEQNIVELPHRLRIDSAASEVPVFLGRNALSMVGNDATLSWRDRHSMAWHDIDQDGLIDVFVGRGGVKGQLAAVPVPLADELFIREGEGFVNRIDGTGIEKAICPGRRSAWVDHDNNGLLDLYISCGRGYLLGYPNQLFSEVDEMQFVEVAAEAGIDYGRISVFDWFDVDQDADMDLLTVDGDKLVLYRNDGGPFIPELLRTDLSSDYPDITLADYDNDGDIDALAISRDRNLLLNNDDGQLDAVDPASIGLPSGARSANWVDYDNDGRIDLHAVPGGLFRQGDDGRFERTGLLALPVSGSRITASRCSWFDADNNGVRDVMCAVQLVPHKVVRVAKKLADRNRDLRYWTSFYYKGEPLDAHWLQIRLLGDRANREAIGARVSVTTAAGTQTREVGVAEGSHYSQGHYRLYFGLAEHDRVARVSVVWPDGSTTEQTDVAGNQLLVIDNGGIVNE